MILKNAVFEMKKGTDEKLIYYRVLAVDQESDAIVVFNVDDNKALPKIMPYQVIISALERAEVTLIDKDPYISLVSRLENEINLKQLEMRDKAYQSIHDLLTNHEWDLFTAIHAGSW